MYCNHALFILGAGIIGGTIGAAFGLVVAIIIIIAIILAILVVNKRCTWPVQGSVESGPENGLNVVSASTKNDKTQVVN